MNPNNDGDGNWIPYGFALLQTLIAGVLAYISKLLRDIRGEIANVKTEVVKHDVKIEEGEKREEMRDREISRRLEHLERKDH